ncbi:MAG: HPF/RaiA family ribosome-associated protein [Planctomycetes bacterium]|nr:HPF/RaiA family ribosome-associated protein [Planctomycetota bacterium]
MQILVNTDSTVQGGDHLSERYHARVEQAIARFSDRITRVEVHLGDDNKAKGGSDDKHCTIEARIAGMQPLAVSAEGGSLDQAVDGAADKLHRAIDSALGRLRDG